MTGPVARPRIVLTGFMGSGKSTVGRTVADVLGVDFLDTDAEIERRTGRTIPELFADGESVFRAAERETVVDVLATSDGVVALGGGSVTVPEIARALDGHHVVYLEITADEGFARVAASDRPLLTNPDPAARYAQLLAARTDTYRAAAGHTVNAADSVSDVVAAVLATLPPHAPGTAGGDPHPAQSLIPPSQEISP